MFVQREFHDLQTDDWFTLQWNGEPLQVVDGNYLEHGNDYSQPHRLIMYYSEGVLHAHAANHEMVWVILP